MQSTCYNILFISGKDSEINALNDYIDTLEDVGKHMIKLENEYREFFNIGDYESSIPFAETVIISSDKWTWDSKKIPSIYCVLMLSTGFPNIEFTLSYENFGYPCKGSLTVKDGELIDEYLVDFEADILEILLDDYKISKLKEGDSMASIGRGGVTIKCEKIEMTYIGVRKIFNLIFSWDNSPILIIDYDDGGNFMDISYQDDDGNEHIEDSEYYYEMVADIQN
ncbi:MAG: hypothetical protein WCG19_05665 [Chlorobiaceae bacterium]